MNIYNKEKFLTYIILSTIFMGSSFPSGKYLIHNAAMPPFWLGGWRFLTAAVLLLIVCALIMGMAEIIPRANGSIAKGLVIVFITGCLQTAGAMGFLNLALRTLDSSISSVIFFTNPLWLAILAHFFLNEKLKGLKIFSLVLGIVGVIVCLGLRGNIDRVGMGYAFLGAICWSLCTLFLKKLFSKNNQFDKSMLILSAWQMLFGALVMLVISYSLKETYDISTINIWGMTWFLWLVIPASIGSFCLWFLALNIGGATFSSCFLFLVPLFSTLFSVLTLHDRLTVQFIIGGLMVIMSLWLINKSEKTRFHVRDGIGTK